MVKDEVRISQEDLEIVINKKTLAGVRDRALEVEGELVGPEVRVETLTEGEHSDARDLGKIDGGGSERLGQGKPYQFDRFADLDVGMNLRQEAITIKGIFSKFGKGCGMKQFWSSRHSQYRRSYEFNIYEDTSRLYRIKGSFLGTQAWKWSYLLREGQEYCFQGANIVIKRFHDCPGDSKHSNRFDIHFLERTKIVEWDNSLIYMDPFEDYDSKRLDYRDKSRDRVVHLRPPARRINNNNNESEEFRHNSPEEVNYQETVGLTHQETLDLTHFGHPIDQVPLTKS